MRKVICVAVIGATLAAYPAAAGQIALSSITSYEVARSCERSTELLEEDFCSGYIVATFDALALTHQVCGSGDSLTAQIVAIGKKYLKEHPEEWDKAPPWVLRKAFQQTFPCNPKNER